MVVELKAEIRESTKKSVTNQLRKAGKVPAAVYGKTVGNQNVAIDEGALIKLFYDVGRNEVIQLQVDGQQTTSVMTQELQRDPIKRHLVHVDFKEVNMNEEVEVAVPLHVVGEDAVEKRDGVVQLHLNELHVRALPGHIPSHIDLDVTELQVGDSIKVENLKQAASQDYEIQNDEDVVLVTINHPQLAADEPVTEEEGNEAESGTDEEKAQETEQE
ncbi:50S ribosomal protein L25/general stress protein Ctc [Pullulanibacillus sp. KACC 23026]|uniref:50S ribosomal protein L25/general stress protein Ctc n=1 Tax=Pullulanibacillus sp. KACC 23026 TaxID=3028315 RepID=UPI0023AF978F|nr:50S ribosomal protein L25/general stress protein Ctc [Pullulanibacillus sp. KACC 23026]WEG12730.1 50S ribosomal protein L25/general stress protein Ctc [Pullulanibacillus sp. KACC 23026]